MVAETCDLCHKMWEKGWALGGGGNVSALVAPDEVSALGYEPGGGHAFPSSAPSMCWFSG